MENRLVDAFARLYESQEELRKALVLTFSEQSDHAMLDVLERCAAPAPQRPELTTAVRVLVEQRR